MKPLLLLHSAEVHIKFIGNEFSVNYNNNKIRISLDEHNRCEVSLIDQRVSYKARLLGSNIMNVKKTGEIDFEKYFMVDWEAYSSVPELIFMQKPVEIHRNYSKGQKIELGIEEVARYHVVYDDMVTADFMRTGPETYNFEFSTNFNGSIRKEVDGSHTINFKGLRRDADEDGYNSESKFIISRSKYTDNLILILQDGATVFLEYD